MERFVEIIPDWKELSVGLDAVLLAEGDPSALGWYTTGIVAVCAHEKELTQEWDVDFYNEHAAVLERIDVELDFDDDTVEVEFTESSIKAFQLMHILLHEIGHHHDRMTTRTKHEASRGEPFAETFALERADELWDAYYGVFPY